MSMMAKDGLDLINRQKAEVEALIAGQETLQKYIAEQKAKIERLEDVNIRLTKAEAIKEFAERLKEKKKSINITIGLDYEVCFVSDIDNLLKELVGEDK
jgi:uncharacterized metal-binding protein